MVDIKVDRTAILIAEEIAIRLAGLPGDQRSA
jgi:hypothetical protein